MSYQSMRLWLEGYEMTAVKQYASKVITDTRLPIYGIPMPALRQKARELSRQELPLLLREARWDSYEEVLLLGLAAAYTRLPFEQKQAYIWQILPYLDSWGHTDSIVPTLKLKPSDREAAWAFATECLESEGEYTVRFGVILLMDYFIDEAWVSRSLAQLVRIRDERYYVRMAVAWCLAEIAVKQLQPVLEILRSGCLDVFTHNKTIQKMRESYRIDADTKAAIRLLKRKE